MTPTGNVTVTHENLSVVRKAAEGDSLAIRIYDRIQLALFVLISILV